MIPMVATKLKTGEVGRDLITTINDRIRQRGHIASGSLISQNSFVATSSGNHVIGFGYALDYWVNVGSGTPKGTDVPFEALVRWAMNKGLTNSRKEMASLAMNVRRKIRMEGSLDYRLGNPNIYLEAIEEFDKSGRFMPTDAAEQDVARAIDTSLKKLN